MRYRARVIQFKARNKIQRGAGALLGGTGGSSHISFRRLAGGYHHVPNVNANSDGDFNFNLGSLENVWNANYAFFSFRDLNDFSRSLLLAGGSFFCKIFLPAPKHAANLIKKKYEHAVVFMINDLLFPTYLQKEFKQV